MAEDKAATETQPATAKADTPKPTPPRTGAKRKVLEVRKGGRKEVAPNAS